MAKTRRKCRYKTCPTHPKSDRYHGYCYEHRNHSLAYLLGGGDGRRLKQARRAIGSTKDWMADANRGLELPRYDSIGEHISSHVGISSNLGRRIGYVLSGMEAPQDTVPEWVAEKASERLDRAGKMLVASGVDVKNIGILHLAELSVTPYSNDVRKRGKEARLPHVEHDALIVKDPKGKHNNFDKYVVLDPNIAALAPVDRADKGKPLDCDDFPPGATPFDEGMYVSDLGGYLSGPQMSWGKYKEEWL